jgi:hypothetical protein
LAHEKSPLTHLRCGLSILPAGLSKKERTAFDSLDMASKKGNRAYFVMMTARPQTVGYDGECTLKGNFGHLPCAGAETSTLGTNNE